MVTPIKSLVVSAVVPLALGLGCTTMPAKAPGSNPGDMTPEAHREASAQEAREAEKHRGQAERVQPSKPAVENAQRSNHERQAERHQSYSNQHEAAAQAATSE
jgi:hypothetical protein